MTEVDWDSLRRPLPDWFAKAKLGIFIHWGAYAVPAFAHIERDYDDSWSDKVFSHTPYAEWYANSMRIPDSPTAAHHLATYQDREYDSFLDDWTAENFDPAQWLELFRAAGAEYVVLTTKHHDGITLWDAPGTGERNTVRRGPKRDLVGEMAAATRDAGLRFGVYYSGGLDWDFAWSPPIRTSEQMYSLRPNGIDYHRYAAAQVRDLITRYQPDVLWNDIEWPDAGKTADPGSLLELLADYRRDNPQGVVNDRWGVPFSDFRTTEYGAGGDTTSGPWEECRGIGSSFGYNAVETDTYASGEQLAALLTQINAGGGRLLLNVGPTADGRIPERQRQALLDLGALRG